MPYPHRATRPLYPEIPDSVCDCALLPEDHPTLPEYLAHTDLLHEESLELSLDEGRVQATYHVEFRRCPNCSQWWWAERSRRTDITHARDSDPPLAIGSVSVALGSAVRCSGRAEADALTRWWADYQDAIARRDRMAEQGDGRDVQRCIDLGHVSVATRQLSESTARTFKRSRDARARHERELRQCIDTLEDFPEDAAAWQALQRLQARCALARAWDAAVEPQDWTREEWWTPALSGSWRLEFEIHAARHAARGKALGSPEHVALRRIEDAIAVRWEAHCERVAWPSPAVAFHALLDHATSLEPMVVRGDMASWQHPDAIGRRLRALLKSGAVEVTRHMTVPAWLATRTGLPDGHERQQQRNAANYWLGIRRAHRAGTQHSGKLL
jgi:hypothetical protein